MVALTSGVVRAAEIGETEEDGEEATVAADPSSPYHDREFRTPRGDLFPHHHWGDDAQDYDRCLLLLVFVASCLSHGLGLGLGLGLSSRGSEVSPRSFSSRAWPSSS